MSYIPGSCSDPDRTSVWLSVGKGRRQVGIKEKGEHADPHNSGGALMTKRRLPFWLVPCLPIELGNGEYGAHGDDTSWRGDDLVGVLSGGSTKGEEELDFPAFLPALLENCFDICWHTAVPVDVGDSVRIPLMTPSDPTIEVVV